MRKPLLRTGICVLALCGILFTGSFVSDSKSTTNLQQVQTVVAAPEYKELILEIADVNDKNFSDIRNSIEGSGGVVFKGYCSELHVFMYDVDRTLHPDNSFLDKLSIKGISFVIKEGSTIEQVSQACGIDNTPNDHSTQTE